MCTKACAPSVRSTPWSSNLWEADVSLNCWRLKFANQKMKTPPPGNNSQSNHRLWEEKWWWCPPLSEWVNCPPLSSFGHTEARQSVLRDLVLFILSFSQKNLSFTVPMQSTVLGTVREIQEWKTPHPNEKNQESHLWASFEDQEGFEQAKMKTRAFFGREIV